MQGQVPTTENSLAASVNWPVVESSDTEASSESGVPMYDQRREALSPSGFLRGQLRPNAPFPLPNKAVNKSSTTYHC